MSWEVTSQGRGRQLQVRYYLKERSKISQHRQWVLGGASRWVGLSTALVVERDKEGWMASRCIGQSPIHPFIRSPLPIWPQTHSFVATYLTSSVLFCPLRWIRPSSSGKCVSIIFGNWCKRPNIQMAKPTPSSGSLTWPDLAADQAVSLKTPNSRLSWFFCLPWISSVESPPNPFWGLPYRPLSDLVSFEVFSAPNGQLLSAS